jgi:hypothetical protein
MIEGHKYRNMVLQIRGLDARLTTLLCKELLLLDSKKLKPGAVWQNLLRKPMA